MVARNEPKSSWLKFNQPFQLLPSEQVRHDTDMVRVIKSLVVRLECLTLWRVSAWYQAVGACLPTCAAAKPSIEHMCSSTNIYARNFFNVGMTASVTM